jgi:hypothetical protein
MIRAVRDSGIDGNQPHACLRKSVAIPLAIGSTLQHSAVRLICINAVGAAE